MKLTYKQLLKTAEELKEQGVTEINISDPATWLAAICASQLTGIEHIMHDWFKFVLVKYETKYTDVPKAYGDWCRKNSEDNNYQPKDIGLIIDFLDEQIDKNKKKPLDIK